MKNNLISCTDEEAKVMVSIDRNVLDSITTDQKYTSFLEDILYTEYGYGFISPDEENLYNIPNYISEDDLIIWEAEKALYDSYISEIYPEAFNKEASKKFSLKKN